MSYRNWPLLLWVLSGLLLAGHLTDAHCGHGRRCDGIWQLPVISKARKRIPADGPRSLCSVLGSSCSVVSIRLVMLCTSLAPFFGLLKMHPSFKDFHRWHFHSFFLSPIPLFVLVSLDVRNVFFFSYLNPQMPIFLHSVPSREGNSWPLKVFFSIHLLDHVSSP